MLDAPMIRRLLTALNDELKAHGVIGEVGICGGAVMCLVFNARQATKDVDGIFGRFAPPSPAWAKPSARRRTG